MKVVLIGAGNVATHLATGLYAKSFDIVQIYSRTMDSASALAEKVHACPTTDISAIDTLADLYIFSVKDSVLEDIIPRMPPNNGLWVHTAGSLPMDIFGSHHAKCGVLYPFQTFSKSRAINWGEVPIFIEAGNQESMDILRHVAGQLSTKIAELSSQDRKYVHLTGVFACNFTNHMYTLSKQFLSRVNLPFEMSLPLINETAAKVCELSPEMAQTGPAIRYDENVINKHLALIEDDSVKQIYRLISENIHKTSKQ